MTDLIIPLLLQNIQSCWWNRISVRW